jgi:hypothetical protein
MSVRCAGRQPGPCPQHGAEVARPRSTHHDCDLRGRRWGGGAEHRRADVVSIGAGALVLPPLWEHAAGETGAAPSRSLEVFCRRCELPHTSSLNTTLC